MNDLINNISNLHTTPMGVERIKKNLGLSDSDPVEWCKERILSKNAEIELKGKNWYITVREPISCTITVNKYSFTIITAHKN